MQVKLLSPLWGHEHLPLQTFLDKVRQAGYDGIDTWMPENADDKRLLFDYLQQHQLSIVTHQHRATGNTYKEVRVAFLKELQECAEPQPILINSHTGRDYFPLEENIALMDIANEFTAKTGIVVAHETHRGRTGYSPQMMEAILQQRQDFSVNADLSHWTCVTESMLENFSGIVDATILRSRQIHSRVGFEQGPQVGDPRAPEWQYALHKFLGWWDRIIQVNADNNVDILPITTEFGPVPYMPVIPFTNKPVADQFEVNCFKKDLLSQRYAAHRS
jgi:hypothetical protein